MMNIRVKDIIAENNDTLVCVTRPASSDPCEPLIDQVFFGMLRDIPEELQKEPVRHTSWSLAKECNVIGLFPNDAREIKEA